MDITKCIYDAISKLEKAIEEGIALLCTTKKKI
jgi:hypothetical protein